MCPICNDESTKVLLDWKDYKINRCLNCWVIFTMPLPTDAVLQQFYQGFMFKKPESHELDNRVKQRRKELSKLFTVDKEKGEELFLDYGAGTGAAFKAAKDLGFDAYYFDIDEDAKEFTKAHFNLVKDRIVEQLEGCQVSFDKIFSDNVIEHVKNPIEFVDKLLDKLNGGGELVIKTPNASNTQAFFNPFISIRGYFFQALKYNTILKSCKAYFGRFWHCDPPRHLYSFSEKSLNLLMNTIEKPEVTHEVLFYNTPWFSNTLTKQYFSRDKGLQIGLSILARIALFPFMLVEVMVQLIMRLGLALGIISPGGLILMVRKAD